jgi:hypothetical protein
MADRNAKSGPAVAAAMLAYVADLELEVDRLRKQGQFVQQHVRTALKRIQGLGGGLFYRRAPVRAPGLGVGLSVVKLLVEQSAGKLTMTSGEGQGSTLVAFLPRYEIDDFLT